MSELFLPPQHIGFIGLGNMGHPMARSLAESGYTLVVADANPDALKHFAVKTACEQAADLKALGGACRVVITMLPDGAAVREVLLSYRGVAAGLGRGSTVIDMSSSSPVGTRDLALELASREIALIDAPVSGGVKKAIDGTLAIMVGGPPDVVERCRPILEVMGKVFHTGETGSGHAMKSLNNYLSAATLAISAEAVIAGTQFGLDPARMIEILNASTGRSNTTEHKYPNFILPRSFDSGFAIGLMAKDLRLALEVATSVSAPKALLQVCADLWSRAEAQLGPTADHTEVVKFLESLVEEQETQSKKPDR